MLTCTVRGVSWGTWKGVKMTDLIALPKLTQANRPFVTEMRRYIWDANMYIRLGYDDQYITGKRCYDKVMALFEQMERCYPT